MLIEASDRFRVPQSKAERTVGKRASFPDLFARDWERDLACIHCALLERAQKDKVVSSGLDAQFMLNGISHVLEVHIVADTDGPEQNTRNSKGSRERTWRHQSV